MIKEEFKNRLETLQYDKFYQDIDYIDFIGYSKSYETWERIKSIFDWKDKKVADLGAFHGYFSFKIAELGGIVTAMDRSPIVLETTEILNQCYGSPIKTQVWVGGEEVSEEFDISLCLNALHHFGDQEKALKNIKSEFALFEVKYDQCFLITQYFDVFKKVQSHRVGRIILLGRKRNE